MLVTQSCWLFVTPWIVGLQAPLSMEFSSKSPGVGYHALLQGSFLSRSNLALLHCRQILYCLSYRGSQLLVQLYHTEIVEVAWLCNYIDPANFILSFEYFFLITLWVQSGSWESHLSCCRLPSWSQVAGLSVEGSFKNSHWIFILPDFIPSGYCGYLGDSQFISFS